MTFNVLLTVLALAVISTASGLAVLSHRFDDTLLQRVALSGICIGSMSCAFWVWDAGYVPPGAALMAASGALFSAETARKISRRICRGAWREY